MSRYTIPNLRRTCEWIHQCCHTLVTADPKPPAMTPAAWRSRLKDESDGAGTLLRQLKHNVAGIDASLGELEAAAADLTKPARQALAWMRFLAAEHRLADHLATLGALHQAVAEARTRPHPHRPEGTAERRHHAPADLWICLRPGPSLYRITTRPDALEVEVHQGYVGATPGVIDALAMLCVRPREPRAVEAIKRYSLGKPFTEVQQALEDHALQLADAPQGQYHDLEASFRRVKAEYFAGRLARPRRLLWTDQPTRCRLGYYNIALDAVVISRTLDGRQVPSFVLDFVMYHELLHKALGVRLRGGRAHSHTAEFRELEARFHRWREAESVIGGLVRGVGNRRR